MAKYGFEEFGRVFLPIYIMPKDKSTMRYVEFMVDTGADSTTISKRDLIDLGYDMDWIKANTIMLEDDDKPLVATGEMVNAGCVQIPFLSIFDYEGKQWPFQIVVDEGDDFMNLLGRDLLTGFNYTFNNDDDEFTIERAKAFKPRSEFLLGQEINIITSS
jgi:predicted aspartyl protease